MWFFSNEFYLIIGCRKFTFANSIFQMTPSKTNFKTLKLLYTHPGYLHIYSSASLEAYKEPHTTWNALCLIVAMTDCKSPKPSGSIGSSLKQLNRVQQNAAVFASVWCLTNANTCPSHYTCRSFKSQRTQFPIYRVFERHPFLAGVWGMFPQFMALVFFLLLRRSTLRLVTTVAVAFSAC